MRLKKTKGTFTAEGFIEHLRFKKYRLPVKIDFNQPSKNNDGERLYHPLKRNDCLIYALPCGGEFCPS